MNSAVEIMDTGFSCLVARLGVVDAERFVAMIFICNSPEIILRGHFIPYLVSLYIMNCIHSQIRD